MICLLLHRFFLLHQVHCSCSLLWFILFYFIHCILQLQNFWLVPFLWFFFVKFLILFLYYFPDFVKLFFCFLIAHWTPLKQLFCILYHENHRSLFFGGQLLENSCFHFVVSRVLLFSAPWSLALLSSYLKKQLPPPVFTDWLGERDTFLQPCLQFWGFLSLFVFFPMIHLLHIQGNTLLWRNSSDCMPFVNPEKPGHVLAVSSLLSLGWCRMLGFVYFLSPLWSHARFLPCSLEPCKGSLTLTLLTRGDI